MIETDKTVPLLRLCPARLAFLCMAVTSCWLCGCKDGPLYALKTVNPYFTMKEWREDDALGVTDHERRSQLTKLSEQIGSMSAERQDFWTSHLQKILDNDPSAEMRRLAVVAAGNLKPTSGLPIIEQGLDDDSNKVKLFACKTLGKVPGDEAARLLASTAGTEANRDVRQAAFAALANHKGSIAVNSLRLALSDRDPATRDLAMLSLRNVTGQNYGTDPDVWIAALDKQTSGDQPNQPAGDARGIFR